jgi:hypothetical protein
MEEMNHGMIAIANEEKNEKKEKSKEKEVGYENKGKEEQSSPWLHRVSTAHIAAAINLPLPWAVAIKSRKPHGFRTETRGKEEKKRGNPKRCRRR